VYRAIFTCTNARVQTTALLMQGTHNMRLVGERLGKPEKEGPVEQVGIEYLSDREAKDAWTAAQANTARPWKLWCAEVANSSLYRNELDSLAGT